MQRAVGEARPAEHAVQVGKGVSPWGSKPALPGRRRPLRGRNPVFVWVQRDRPAPLMVSKKRLGEGSGTGSGMANARFIYNNNRKIIANDANGQMKRIFYRKKFASFEKFAQFAIKCTLRRLQKECTFFAMQNGPDQDTNRVIRDKKTQA